MPVAFPARVNLLKPNPVVGHFGECDVVFRAGDAHEQRFFCGRRIFLIDAVTQSAETLRLVNVGVFPEVRFEHGTLAAINGGGE